MNPLVIFLLLFIGIPLIELYFLIEVGSVIGAFPTIFLTIFTALVGGWLVRMQGFKTALRVRGGMERGEVPAIEMLEGVVLLLCGILLLLPGFFTDLFGFLCLVPAVRRAAIVGLLRRSGTLHPAGSVHPDSGPVSGPVSGTVSGTGEPKVIEGEYQRHDD